jgi:cytoskeletal protein RodZ
VDRIPKWAQAVLLVVIIGGSAFWLYSRFVVNTPEKVRMRQKEQWDSKMTSDTTKELRDNGKQKAGPSDYVIEAKNVKGNDYVNASIRKTTADGKVTEEIKAPRMTVTVANAVEFTVTVFDATRTTYDEAGNAKTETISGPKEFRLYVSGPHGGPGAQK